MPTENIKIEYESKSSQSDGKACGCGKSEGKSKSESSGLNVNGLELDSLVSFLSESHSKFNTITIKSDNSILIS